MANATIKYFSTNAAIFGTSGLDERIADGSLQTVGLAEAIITGQAADGGLLMPTHFPEISLEAIAGMKNMSYAQVFVETAKGFFEGVLSESTLERIAKEAYEGSHPFKPFIEPISERDFIGRLDEGPTAAFKDYAAQILFRVIEALMKEEPKSEIAFRQRLKDIELLSFITSTSGDTGPAMGIGCLNREKMWMAILHSADIGREISDLQAKQMDTLGNNVYALWIKTDFDGCQKHVQNLLKDPELQYMSLNTANSINIGRLLSQIAYYFHIYSRVAKSPNETIYFSVPCGNFSDAVSGLFAIRMGLPAKLILGVNENDVIARFYNTGLYEPAPKTHSSPSNSMNINWPSNMRRFVQLYHGQLIEGEEPASGKKIVSGWVAPDMNYMKRENAVAYSISDEENRKGILDFYQKRHKIKGREGGDLISTLDPHGDVAYESAQRFRAETGYEGTIVSLLTGHPGKFSEVLHEFGIKPQLPLALAKLVNKPHGAHFTLEDDYNAIKACIVQLYRQELAKSNKH